MLKTDQGIIVVTTCGISMKRNNTFVAFLFYFSSTHLYMHCYTCACLFVKKLMEKVGERKINFRGKKRRETILYPYI